MRQLRLLLGNVYDGVSPWLPARLSGLLDWHFRPFLRNGFSGPFNGQNGRVEIFRQVMACVRFNAIVETGTYCGTTSEFLSNTSGLPVYTSETMPRYFYYSRRRFRGVRGVHVELSDSRSFVGDLAGRPGIPHDRVFFYLDAHSITGILDTDHPLGEELEIIAQGWTDPVIMIDDFEVPDDPGYQFDKYGPGKHVNVDLLPVAFTKEFRLFWPVLRGQDETGRRRGYVVAARRNLAASKLEHLSVLREIPAPIAA